MPALLRCSLGAFLLLACGCLDGRRPHSEGGADGGAAAVETWPADGTYGVPPSLPLAIVHFPAGNGSVLQAARIEALDAAPVPATVEERSCPELAYAGGRCLALVPLQPLAPWTGYRIVVGNGAGAVSRFATGPAGPGLDVGWLSPGCAVDEDAVGPACVLAMDDRLVVRVRAGAPVRLWLTLDGSRRAVAVAPRGDADLRFVGLAPDTTYDGVLRAQDLAGGATQTPLLLATTPALTRLFITEVRADPRGPEPQQEYVEVVNSGAMPLDLSGYALADSPDALGDVVGEPAVAPAGGRVLLVPDKFDPDQPDDPPVPPGVPLVHLGSALGSGGLSNAGEPVFLRDPLGHRLSAAPALAAPGPGVCLVRVSDDGRTGEAGAFGFDAAGGCTPGLPDRIP